MTPVVDCMVPEGHPDNFYVYYGYVNPGPQITIDFGEQNQVIPGSGFQGQPTVFNIGSYPSVFKALFNAGVFPEITWELDGNTAIATAATPLCRAGATGPASDLATKRATLHGLVESRNVDTAYNFEYGTTIAYGQTTAERHLTAPTSELVEEPLIGLAPGTTYHYRLLATGSVATVGDDRTFETQALPVPVPLPDPIAPPQGSTASPPGENARCATLRRKLKRAKKKPSKRKIRRQLRHLCPT